MRKMAQASRGLPTNEFVPDLGRGGARCNIARALGSRSVASDE